MSVGNGAEFIGRIVDLWAHHHKVRMEISMAGTPMDNVHIDAFKSSFRDDCLNLNWFESIAEARRRAEAWRRDDNESRPQMALSIVSSSDQPLAASMNQQAHVRLLEWRRPSTIRRTRLLS